LGYVDSEDGGSKTFQNVAYSQQFHAKWHSPPPKKIDSSSKSLSEPQIPQRLF
jgi:hypothetical protein